MVKGKVALANGGKVVDKCYKCQGELELTPFRLVLMSIGSVPWYRAVCLLFSEIFTRYRYRWSQIAKRLKGFNGRRGKRNKSCAFRLWEGPERRASMLSE